MRGSITERFAELKAAGKKALIVFFTAGDQRLCDLPGIISALEEGGADLIEVGVPFSDPYGEGLVIQASSQHSLANGTTPRAILEALGSLSAGVPLVTMGYYNPVLRFGVEAYAAMLREVGVAGSIIQDLVPEEADAWCAAAEQNGRETIFLAAPTSTDRRITEVCRRSTGFVYAISRTGVTGADHAVPPEVGELVGRLKALTTRPVCVGFGISKPEHVKMVCDFADGAVVGSSLVALLHEKWDGGRGRDQIVAYVRSLKVATESF